MFRLDTRKAIEATATLIRLSPHRVIGRKRLLALLYLADRECLKRTARPIIGGRLVAMKYGPIHSEVYDLIKGGHRDQAEWSKHFDNDAHLVVLRHEPAISALSRYEIGLLNEISQQFMGYDDWDVAEATHEFAEYGNSYKKDTSTPIPLEQVIDAVGLAKKKSAILKDAEQRAFFDKLFLAGRKPTSKRAANRQANKRPPTTVGKK